MISNEMNSDLKWATDYLSKVRKPKTISQYLKLGKKKCLTILKYLKWQYECIDDRNNNRPISESPIASDKFPGQSGNRNTRLRDRAEMKFVLANWIVDNPDEKCSHFVTAKRIKKHIEDYASINLLNKCNISTTTAISSPNKSKVQVKKSKRKSLRGLPKNWRETLAIVSQNSKYSNQILIMILCGCRPAELQLGIKVIRTPTQLEFHINGAKLSNTNLSGQPMRIITIDINNPIFGNLKSGTYFAKANAIEDAVSHFGLKVVKRTKNKISAYSLRHAFASDLKASGFNSTQVSAGLGHQSTITKSTYGGRSRIPSIVITSINATLPVRTVIKNSKLISSKMNSPVNNSNLIGKSSLNAMSMIPRSLSKI